MASIAASSGQVVFIPKGDSSSYFYESFECQPAITKGYGAIQFTVEGPAGGSMAFELQTASSCAATDGTYRSSWTIIENLTGSRQLINLPLIGFDNDPNYDAIVGLVWSTFSKTGVQWSIGNITLVCGKVVEPTPSSTAVTTVAPTRSTVVPTNTRSTIPPTSTANPATCSSNLLIDDWASQSRLTFLGYNALGQPSSDDGSMASVVVSGNRILLSPRNSASYFYSQFGCLNVNKYGGISLRIRAARGTSFALTVSWYTTCGGSSVKTATMTTAQLNWVFDGTERVYWFPFSVFTGVDTTKLDMIFFSNFNAGVIFGPVSFFCGTTGTEYRAPAGTPAAAAITRSTTPAAAPNVKNYVIDAFSKQETNELGEWHGADDGMTVTFGNKEMTIRTNDSDLSWNTQLANKCADLRSYAGGYLHIAYKGSNKFSVALQQHNAKCDETIKPFPETWDSVEAPRYASASDIYIPINHFNVNLTRALGFNLRGFYSTEATTISKIEIVDAPPKTWTLKTPAKLASGKLVFACTRPNSFAFAIDDGDPKYTKRVMDILKNAAIPITFFTVGLPLLDSKNGLAEAYKDMASRGHQIALHSYTHPKMEGLATDAEIDWELTNDIGAVNQVFPNLKSSYFRPPFGTEGARMRQRLAANLKDPNPYIVGWSIDVEDWIWAETSTPEKQLDAFKRDLAKGGNLLVMHYLYESTVELLPEFIRLAKASGKKLMRVDQCLEDPAAPAL
ncbi:hypothetical protein QBC44DRAFT_318343, partial [Cladorrhinum sp. PSN332]